MRKSLLFSVASFAIVLVSTQTSLAQGAGVCNRQADEISNKVNADASGWFSAIDSSTPADERAAYQLLFSRNRDRTLAVVAQQKDACTAEYKPMQDMMDAAVTFYTAGLSKILAPQMTHVDVSELLNGYPLGGPNALIPKFREDILRGDNSTVSNIIRDPWKCITFQRKC